MMKQFKLNNGINAVLKQNKNTPRTAVSIAFEITEPEKSAGVYSLMNRLLMQGTQKRSSEQLATELDDNAIELSFEMKQDYLRCRVLCLNEDIDLAIEIMEDTIKNSTFKEFDKEKNKFKGELVAELDSAKNKALDNFITNIFKNHYYGNFYTKILENLPDITTEDVLESYHNIIKNGKKFIAVVGDIDSEKMELLLNKSFGDIENSEIKKTNIKAHSIIGENKFEIIKVDAQQSQIFQGWILPSYECKDYPAIIVMNTLLGSSGLSSRLFLELRDKKGLAYTVRSSYETYKACANFNIYIATEPKNIQVSLDGFKEEIQKLKDTLVSEEELQSAKNNYLGKQQFILETNIQQALKMTHLEMMDLGFDFQEKLENMIKSVTAEDVQRVVKTYLNDNTVISILKP